MDSSPVLQDKKPSTLLDIAELKQELGSLRDAEMFIKKSHANNQAALDSAHKLEKLVKTILSEPEPKKYKLRICKVPSHIVKENVSEPTAEIDTEATMPEQKKHRLVGKKLRVRGYSIPELLLMAGVDDSALSELLSDEVTDKIMSGDELDASTDIVLGRLFANIRVEREETEAPIPKKAKAAPPSETKKKKPEKDKAEIQHPALKELAISYTDATTQKTIIAYDEWLLLREKGEMDLPFKIFAGKEFKLSPYQNDIRVIEEAVQNATVSVGLEK